MSSKNSRTFKTKSKVAFSDYSSSASQPQKNIIFQSKNTKNEITQFETLDLTSKNTVLTLPMTASIKESKNNWGEKLKLSMKRYFTIEKKEFDWKDDIDEYDRKFKRLNKAFFPLHKDFKHEKPIQSYYVLIDISRQIFLCLTVVTTFDIPFIGLIIVNLINIVFFFGLINIRPFKKNADFVQNILNEICLLTSGISAFVLISMEKFEITNLDFRMNLGWIMVACNTFLILLFLLRIGVNFLILFSVLMRFLFTILLKILRKSSKVGSGDNNDESKKDDKTLMQQILEIQNFLR